MIIERGLFDHMVLQRVSGEVSDAVVEGKCSESGAVLATIMKSGRVFRRFRSVVVGKAAKGRFTARLAGVPVGGPYDVKLSVGKEHVLVSDVLVGDVWLLGGQSNMQGCGLQTGAARPMPLVRAFFMDDRWAVAKDPIHNRDAAVDEVHVRLAGGVRPPVNKVTGVGPGVAFGQEMQRLTGAPQGLIACGHGGTSMSQWAPKLKRLGSGSLYGAMIRRFVKNGSKVAGLVWYQGESDAHEEGASLYTQRMKRFVAALRRDTGIKDLPVAIVQLSRVLGQSPQRWVYWNSIQEQQRLMPKYVKRLTVVPAVDLPLDDSIHISGVGQQVLGRRLAQAMAALIHGRKAGLPPIELKSVRIGRSVRDTAEVVAEFDNVVGKLRSSGRPHGFEIGTPTPGNFVYDVVLEGKSARIKTIQSHRDIEGQYLWYGAGTDPYCNIVDEAGRSLPVFGPIPLGKARALTPFIRHLRVSDFLPSAGKLETLARPDLSSIPMTGRYFDADFCDIHFEVARRNGADELVVYACRFACPEPMKLKLEIGYDGPTKVWVDDRMLFHDPNGTNPAVPVDKGTATFQAAAGEHELIVALGTNHGAAWGVYLRFERLDVSRRKVNLGPGAYAMPKFLG